MDNENVVFTRNEVLIYHKKINETSVVKLIQVETIILSEINKLKYQIVSLI